MNRLKIDTENSMKGIYKKPSNNEGLKKKQIDNQINE